jgi:hypothetical protein
MVREHEIDDILWFLESDLHFAAKHGLTIEFSVKHDAAYDRLSSDDKKNIDNSMKILSTDETEFED